MNMIFKQYSESICLLKKVYYKYAIRGECKKYAYMGLI